MLSCGTGLREMKGLRMLRALTVATAAWLLAQTAQAESALDECWAESAKRIELSGCLNNAKAGADAMLDTAYRAALAAQESLDVTAGNRRATRAVERAELAFSLYRNLECHVREIQMGSGTGSGDAFLGCWVDMTRARAAALAELVPRPRPVDLGGAWQVAKIAGESALVEPRPTVVFDEDGQISGNAGCNDFFGPVTIGGDSIEVSELLGITMKVCGERIDGQESRFLQALSAARRLQLDRRHLILFDTQGEPVLRLER